MSVLKDLQKKYNLKTASELVETERIKTGIFALDYVLDGGISRCCGGHRIEFAGGESSTKTTFALNIIAKYQSLGKTCVFIDGEGSYVPSWGEKCGVNNEDLVVIYPKSLEELGDILVEIIPSIDLIVIDSITSFIPEEEIARDTNQPTMALQARINGVIVRKIYNSIGNSETTLLFINQIRETLSAYGNPEVTSGGRALKHLYNTQVRFRKGKPIDVNKERIGIEINLRNTKNKKGMPYRTSVVDFYFDGKIDNKKSLLYAGVKYGVIQRAGAYYSYKDIKEQGQEKFNAKLTKEIWEEIEENIWKGIKEEIV